MIKNDIKRIWKYILAFSKWLVIALSVGVLGGLIGSFFHLSVDFVTELRESKKFILYFLPLGGLLIVFLYRLFSSQGKIDTNRVIEAVRENEKVPLIMVPLIFISTVITHMLGGSAGREGAALQLGGGIGYNLGKLFKFKENDLHIIIMSGMSSVFAALFGTPLTAAIFALEVTSVGILNYAGFFPCVTASLAAFGVSQMLGIPPVKFPLTNVPALSTGILIQVIIISLLCAVVSILFVLTIEKFEHYGDTLIKNSYLRAFAGGSIIVLLSLLVRSHDYNGAGMDIITKALSGQAKAEAFIFKIIFTVITIAAGYKGGEIVPAFFIGSTFGCVMGSMLGMDSGFAAAIGFVALFCGVVNCPVASIILSVEVFGADSILFFAIACAVSYMMSGHFGLYKSQKIVYSKLNAEYININAK